MMGISGEKIDQRYYSLQSCMTLTDIRLTEFMYFTEKMGYKEAPYSVNKRHDFSGIHDISGNFPYDDIFRKNHARLYFLFPLELHFLQKQYLKTVMAAHFLNISNLKER